MNRDFFGVRTCIIYIIIYTHMHVLYTYCVMTLSEFIYFGNKKYYVQCVCMYMNLDMKAVYSCKYYYNYYNDNCFFQSTTNTFQGILITDGSSSYAVFIYNCSNMEWGGGVIGWQQSTTQYASYYASGQSSSNTAVCVSQTTSFTTLVYRVYSDQSPYLSPPHSSIPHPFSASSTCNLLTCIRIM